MARWLQLSKLPLAGQEQVIQIYKNENFPMEIRHLFGVWIESQNWDLAAADEGYARSCFCQLLSCFEKQHSQFVQENILLQGPNLSALKSYMQIHFEANPVNLAVIMSKCLSEEKMILAASSNTQHGVPNDPVAERQAELDLNIEELRQKIQVAKSEIKSLEERQEEHDFRLKALQQQVEQLNGAAQVPVVQREKLHLATQLNELNQIREAVGRHITDILTLAGRAASVVVGVELPEWKLRQQKACLGAPVDTSLEQLQMRFTAVAESLLQLRQQLEKLREQGEKYPKSVAPLRSQCEDTLVLLRLVLEKALVVEKQPCTYSMPQRPLVIKTGVRFTVKLRFLVKLPEFCWLSKVTPVFDKDVDELGTANGFRKFVFTTDRKKIGKMFEAEDPDGGVAAEFGRLSLKVSANRSNECSLTVTEELHVVTFVTRLQLRGLEVDIEVSSLPLVVVSSTNQIHSAWASIMWSNMLNIEPKNLLFFLRPPPLTWPQLSEVLSWQFFSVGQRGLDEHQLSMLKDKFVENQDDIVHWNKFSKGVSAWFWIEGILDLIPKHLLGLWRDGYIMGFGSREAAEELLKDKPSGTFLLRFSESSKDGAITFSWVDHSSGKTHVHAVKPYTKKDLMVTSMPDILRNYVMKTPSSVITNPLQYLYPDIPKDAAFAKYYSTRETQNGNLLEGYLERTSTYTSEYPTPPPSPPHPPSPPSQPPLPSLSTSIPEDMDTWTEPLPTVFDPALSEQLLRQVKGLCE